VVDRRTDMSANVSPKYYVDENCIACCACVLEAPLLFAIDEDQGIALVVRQPQNEQELSLMQATLELCPVGAIRDDS